MCRPSYRLPMSRGGLDYGFVGVARWRISYTNILQLALFAVIALQPDRPVLLHPFLCSFLYSFLSFLCSRGYCSNRSIGKLLGVSANMPFYDIRFADETRRWFFAMVFPWTPYTEYEETILNVSRLILCLPWSGWDGWDDWAGCDTGSYALADHLYSFWILMQHVLVWLQIACTHLTTKTLFWTSRLLRIFGTFRLGGGLRACIIRRIIMAIIPHYVLSSGLAFLFSFLFLLIPSIPPWPCT